MSDSQVIFINDPKDPKSEEDFNWDCGPMLKVGDTIASVTKIFLERGDASLTMGTPAINAGGTIVTARLGGGRRGQRYRVTAYFTTATGEKLAMSLEFDCT